MQDLWWVKEALKVCSTRSLANGNRPGTFGAALQLELNGLSLFQTVEIQFLEAAAVEEDLLSVFRADKTKTSIPNNPLDYPLHKHLACKKQGWFCHEFW